MNELLASRVLEYTREQEDLPASDGHRHLLQLVRTPKDAWVRAQKSYGWLRHVQTRMGRFQIVVMVAFVVGTIVIAMFAPLIKIIEGMMMMP